MIVVEPAAAGSCRDVVELVTDEFDGALPKAVLTEYRAHLAQCEDCRTFREQIRVVVACLGQLRRPQVGEETVPAVRSAKDVTAATRTAPVVGSSPSSTLSRKLVIEQTLQRRHGAFP
jgi:predicted anti-sigma-YlaC factor YlaD